MKEYSNDGGRTWEGPFSETEIQNLQECGVITAASLLRSSIQVESVTPDEVPQEYVAPPQEAPAPEEYTAQYYLNTGGTQPAGPFPLAQIQEMAAAGTITPQRMIWRDGWPAWIPVAEILPAYILGGYEPPVPQAAGISDFLADIIGTGRAPSLGVKAFFSEVFHRHKEGDVEAFFCLSGTSHTQQVVCYDIPKPWIYTRVFLAFVGLLVSFTILQTYSPAMGFLCFSVTLNFAVPFVMLVLFAETNIQRNISWFKILQMFFIGGLCSIFFTYVVSEQIGAYEAYWAGPVEETAKLIACLLVAGPVVRKGGVLQGILCGAAVGAGFAIPESIQYFANTIHEASFIALKDYTGLVANGQIHTPKDILEWMNMTGSQIADISLNISYLRAVLSPLGHLLYTPIVAAAAWRAMDGKPFSPAVIFNWAFIRLAIIGVLLHMFWNSPILADGDSPIMKIGIVAVVGWTVLLLLLREGVDKLKQRPYFTEPYQG